MNKKIILINLLLVGIGLIIMATDDKNRCADAQTPMCQKIIYPIVQGFPNNNGTGTVYIGHTGTQSYSITSFPPGTTNHYCWLGDFGYADGSGSEEAGCGVSRVSSTAWQVDIHEDTDPNVECGVYCLSW